MSFQNARYLTEKALFPTAESDTGGFEEGATITQTSSFTVQSDQRLINHNHKQVTYTIDVKRVKLEKSPVRFGFSLGVVKSLHLASY